MALRDGRGFKQFGHKGKKQSFSEGGKLKKEKRSREESDLFEDY